MHALLLSAILLAPAAPPLVIGLLLPPDEPQAQEVRRGAEMAVSEAGGGVRLAVRGRKGAWGSDASEAARLVEDDGAAALVAPPGGAATHLVLQIAGRTGVPVATLCEDSSVTASAIPWAVRVAPAALEEARALFSASPHARWIAFVPSGRGGREASADLRRAAAGAADITRILDSEVPDLRAPLASEKPDGVLLFRDAAASGRLARALRASGFAGTLAGPSRLSSPAFRKEAGDAAEGVLVAGLARDREFETRYRARYGTEPETVSALAHDGTAFLIDIVRRAGAGEPRSAFPYAGSFPGATGPLSFDRHGNRIVSLELRRLPGRSGRM